MRLARDLSLDLAAQFSKLAAATAEGRQPAEIMFDVKLMYAIFLRWTAMTMSLEDAVYDKVGKSVDQIAATVGLNLDNAEAEALWHNFVSRRRPDA